MISHGHVFLVDVCTGTPRSAGPSLTTELDIYPPPLRIHIEVYMQNSSLLHILGDVDRYQQAAPRQF